MMWEYGMGWGWLMMILFWLAPILLVMVALKYLLGSRLVAGGRDEGKKALEILEERYARGEIDREEFLKKRDDLKRG